MTDFNKADLAPFIAELETAIAAEIGAGADVPFDERPLSKVFDLHGFDTRLAAILGIETPDDYAQRKAEAEDLPMPVSALDEHSFARKLVAMLGDGWLWSISSDTREASVFKLREVGGPIMSTIKGDGPLALRLAALSAMQST